MGKKGKKGKQERPGPSISIGGNVDGPVTIGDSNLVVGSVSQGGSVVFSGGSVSQVFTPQQQTIISHIGTVEEVKSLEEGFKKLDEEIETKTPQDLRAEAKQQADQLKEQVVSAKPDLTIIEQVKGWFITNLPALLGSVTGILTHPIVGKLVESAGEFTLDQFRKRLGLSEAG